MKIKHKIGFVALVTIVDIMVILLVVMSNSKTNVKISIIRAHLLKCAFRFM